jgi:thioredoxin 1
MLPVISNFAEENPNVKTCKVNVEACPNIAIKNKIATIPTFLVFKDGKIVNESKMVGIQNKETLVAKTNI